MKKYNFKRLMILLLIVLSSFLGWVSVIYMDYNHHKAQQDTRESEAYDRFAATYELNIRNAMAYVYGLQAFVYANMQSSINPETFDIYAQESQKNAPFIKNFSIAPDNIQFYVYPYEGNEMTLGHNLNLDTRPEVVEAIQEAVTHKSNVYSGPYPLRQGGLGLVVRTPIYNAQNYWGLVNVVIDMQGIIDDATTHLMTTALSLSHKNISFYETSTCHDRLQAIHSFELDANTWAVYGHLSHGLHKEGLISVALDGFLLLILLSLLTYFLIRLLNNNLIMSQKIKNLIYVDQLTKIPNRRALTTTLDQWILTQTPFALAFLDLDGFKDINDNLGHSVGDEILVILAHRLEMTSDSNVYRWGGDEFVILHHHQTITGFIEFIEAVMEDLAMPFQLHHQSFSLSCSIGISIYPSDGHSKDELLKHADATMYAVKNHGKNGFGLYNEALGLEVKSTYTLERRLEEALECHDLHMNYQPKVLFATGKTISFEALVRWPNPEGGFTPPSTFVALAENTRLICKLDAYVLEAVIKQMYAWQCMGYPIAISVNISPKTFNTSLIPVIDGLLKTYPLQEGLLDIEITEAVAIKDFQSTSDTIASLKHRGISVALDDFGTGYSALSYLSQLDFTTIKIDQSFIRKMTDHNNAYAIVKAILGISQALSIQTVAEGVENKDQWQMLKDMSCDICQGYLISKAIPPQEVIDFLTLQFNQEFL